MAPTPEEIVASESRARLWQRQRTRRVHFQSALWQSLSGSPSALRALNRRWQPLTDYLAERDHPTLDSEQEIDPLGISDTTNTGL
jgi:hypothetical protein